MAGGRNCGPRRSDGGTVESREQGLELGGRAREGRRVARRADQRERVAVLAVDEKREPQLLLAVEAAEADRVGLAQRVAPRDFRDLHPERSLVRRLAPSSCQDANSGPSAARTWHARCIPPGRAGIKYGGDCGCAGAGRREAGRGLGGTACDGDPARVRAGVGVYSKSWKAEFRNFNGEPRSTPLGRGSGRLLRPSGLEKTSRGATGGRPRLRTTSFRGDVTAWNR